MSTTERYPIEMYPKGIVAVDFQGSLNLCTTLDGIDLDSGFSLSYGHCTRRVAGTSSCTFSCNWFFLWLELYLLCPFVLYSFVFSCDLKKDSKVKSVK